MFVVMLLRSGDVSEGIKVVRIMSHIVRSIHKRKVYKGRLPCISMEVDGHEEITGEEIDWECDADPHGQRQEEFCN